MSNCGKDLRFQVKLAGTFVSLDGETSVSGTINREAADATAKSSMPWRDILQYCGLASATAKCSGFPVSGLTPSVWQALQTAARMGDLVECAIVHIDPVTAASTVFIRFFGLVTSFDRGGDKNAAETYTITVESSGIVSDSALILKVATPVFSPTGGTITTSDLITLTCATSGATVYYTIDGSTPSPTSAIDASKWIGSWSFDTDDTSSITGTPNLGSSFAGYPVTLASISGGVLNSAPSSESARAVASGISITTGSFAAFITQSSSVHLIYFGFNTSSAGAVLRLISDGRVQGAGITTGVFTPNYSSRYHLAATYDGTTVSVYKDGVLTYSGALTLGAGSAITGVYFGYASGAPARQVDSFIATQEVLSASTVASLATGALPDASGRLSSGTYLYTAPFTLPVQSGLDTSKWLGAYDFPTSPSLNIVTSSPAGSLYTGAGGTVSSSKLVLSTPGQQGVTTWAGTLVTGVSFSCNAKYAALSAMLIRIQLSSSSYPNIYLNSGIFYDWDGNPVSGYASPALIDGAEHHYVWTWDFASRTMVVYRDGSVFETVTTPIFGPKTVDRAFLEAVSGASSTTYIGKFTVYNGVLSAAAISSLAAGNMPNSSGVLAGAPGPGVTTVKAIGVKASYLDSDVASATFTVNQLVYSVAWGDSGLKLSNQGSYLTSLIRSTLPLPTSRKIYFEVAGVYAPDNQNRVQIGVTLSTKPVYPSTLGHPLGVGADEYVTQLPDPDDGGVYFYNRSPNVLSGTAIPVVGTRIGILWDGVNGEFSVKALNTGGASQSVFSVKTGMNGNAWYLCFGGSSAGAGGNIQAEMFVTPASLSYSVPSGYEAGWSD